MKKIALLLTAVFSILSIRINAQCPVAASCTPGIATNAGLGAQGGIYNVTLNTINNTTAGDTAGYENFSCTIGTNLTVGQNYSISITTGPSLPENVHVYIDLDNNGTFNISELLFTSSATINHAGIINVPSTAVLGTALRMRISSDWIGSPLPTSCSTPVYGQVEDYKITAAANTSPPLAAFSTNDTLTCDGMVDFTDISQNSPTSWFWDFGDSNTDTVQNPNHAYTASGTYTVTLIVTNGNGSDTAIYVNYINYNDTVPIAASCTPTTGGYCCGYGIYNVTYNTINNSSSDGQVGYEDFTCTHKTYITEGVPYNISIGTSPTEDQDTKVWIDLNNDGVFNNTNELVFTSLGTKNPSGNIQIPGGAVLDTALRMRVVSDYDGSSFDQCSGIQRGQAEDYSVIIQANTNPPGAVFYGLDSLSCNGTVQFFDVSLNAVTSWKWYFGDGDSATVQNPTHTYLSTGIFTVTLIVSNSFGTDTLIKTNYIVYNSAPVAACIPSTANHCCGVGILNVTFNTINNTTASGSDGYQDYSCGEITTVKAGQSYSLSVTTGTNFTEEVNAWIDYNNDGSFTATELVLNSQLQGTHTGNVVIPASAVKGTNLRMRIASDHFFNPPPPACGSVSRGQHEDYGIVIEPDSVPPTANFYSPDTVSCGNIIQFFDQTTNVPTSWLWYFGDGDSSTSQNPTHTYLSLGTYDVTLIVCNQWGCDTLNEIAYMNIIDTGSMTLAICEPQTTTYCCGVGITNVTFNTINNTTGNAAEGYVDYSCTDETIITEGVPYNLSITVGTGFGENIRTWIDYNDDGAFTAAELLSGANNVTGTQTGSVTVPNGVAIYNKKLRMRIASDFSGNPAPDGCSDLTFGQTEDYGITILQNTSVPIANFGIGNIEQCETTVSFYDSSSAVVTWLWLFGDGDSSTVPSPTHTYTDSGTYDVTLIACNGNGCDTLIMTGAVVINTSHVIPASCSPQTTGWCCGVGILNVNFETLNNTTGDGSEGYKDLTCIAPVVVQALEKYELTVKTGTGGFNEDVKAWIDANNDGVFDDGTELIFNSVNDSIHIDSIIIPDGGVYNDTVRMRIMSEFTGLGIPTACSDLQYGQTEDYAVIITQPDTTSVGFDNNLVQDIHLWPNPATNQLNLTMELLDKQNIHIELINNLGQRVYSSLLSGKNINQNFDISEFSPGLYFMRISGDKFSQTQKVIFNE